MIKRVTDIINLLIFGTGKKNVAKQKIKYPKSRKNKKISFNPKRSKIVKINSIDIENENENNSNFKKRISTFFSRKKNATPEKKLFMKWVQKSKELPTDSKEVEKLFAEYLKTRKRILNFEESSFKNVNKVLSFWPNTREIFGNKKRVIGCRG